MPKQRHVAEYVCDASNADEMQIGLSEFGSLFVSMRHQEEFRQSIIFVSRESVTDLINDLTTIRDAMK